ncbi:MAG: 3-hydroxyacyl-CoA dehydrogenase NAD-binding domain-containing protein [Sphingobium sp.]|nr:MAG: 3-hydroxyacyl-CoA dehydrogenase NAD-binding domain-containing protein [Sphingobium sp.]
MQEPLPGVLEHIEQARRTASVVKDIPADTPLLPIRRLGVIGAGTMGSGITMNFLTAGLPVTLLDRSQDALDKGVAMIERNYQSAVKRGKIDTAQAEAAMTNLAASVDFADLANADLIIEAVYENMDTKKGVFAKLDKIAKPDAILASNTSNLDIDEIALATSRPQSVLGMHFFSPAHVMKLLEVVRGKATGKQQLATVMALAVAVGKTPVVSGVCYGFIGNRILHARQIQAQALIMEGAKYWDVDAALLEFGFPMGPWQMADLAGIDLGWHRDACRIENLQDALCAAGRWGQKTGKGFYDYDENRKPKPSPEVEALIETFAQKTGKPQREIGKQEIRERLLYPMINEAALILQEGIAQRASDVDTVWLSGYGWPAWTGGPMFWAHHLGLKVIVKGLEKYSLPVAPLLAEKAEAGTPLE